MFNLFFLKSVNDVQSPYLEGFLIIIFQGMCCRVFDHIRKFDHDFFYLLSFSYCFMEICLGVKMTKPYYIISL